MVFTRTLARYLQELVLFSYVQVAGGNKHRGGFIYKLTDFNKQSNLKSSIEADLQVTLKNVWNAYNSEKNNNTKPDPPAKSEEAETSKKIINHTSASLSILKPENINTPAAQEPAEVDRKHKRIRIEEKEEHTLKLLLELEAQQPEREYLPYDFTAITGRNYTTEARHLKTLWEQGKLNREWKNRQYCYMLANTSSKTVSQNAVSNSQTQQQQDFDSRTTQE